MSAVAPHTLEVQKLVPGGQGYARLPDGRVALLRGVVAQDRVESLQSQVRKGFVEVTDWRLLESSPDRVEPPCPVAQRCGGCDWMMLSERAQTEAKLSILREALTRTGKIPDLPNDIEWVPSPKPLGYRSRIRLQVSHLGQVGFYSAASHELVEAPRCAVADAAINTALEQLRSAGRKHPKALGSFAHVEIRSAPTGSVSLLFVRNPNERTRTIDHSALFAELRQAFSVCVDDGARNETTWQRYPLAQGVELKAPPGTFTQVNWEVNQLLIAAVVRGALERGIHSFIDLYCGSGNFTLPLLAAGLTGVGVEGDPLAIAAARSAAREQHLAADGFHSMDVEKYLKAAVARDERCEWLLVDPPRAGFKAGLPAVAEIAQRFVAICSCDPVTLARDLRGLIDRGFSLQHLTAFDMFPQTHHLETLAWLERDR